MRQGEACVETLGLLCFHPVLREEASLFLRASTGGTAGVGRQLRKSWGLWGCVCVCAVYLGVVDLKLGVLANHELAL